MNSFILALALLGDMLYANPLLLGFAWQRGWLPLRHESLMRALLLVLDSVGIGHAPDAAKYGDEGANTLGHIFARVPTLKLPNLCALGLPKILDAVFRLPTGPIS